MTARPTSLVAHAARFAAGFLAVSLAGALTWPLLPRHYESPAAFVLLVGSRSDEPGAATRTPRQFPDEAESQSAIDMLSSPELAAKVVAANGLEDDPEFNQPNRLLAALSSLPFVGGLLPRVAVTPALVRDRLARRLRVARDRRSYVVTFGYWSSDPVKAAALTASLLDTYVSMQADIKRAAIARNTGWLEERVATLRRQSTDADAAVRALMEETGLMDVGAQASLESQLTTLSAQYALARTAAIDAGTRAAMLKAMKADGRIGDAPDVIASALIQKLKQAFGSSIEGTYVGAQVAVETNHIVAAAVAQSAEAHERMELLAAELKTIRDAIKLRAVARMRLDVLLREAKATHTVLEESLVRLGGQTALVRAIAPEIIVTGRPEPALDASFPKPLYGLASILAAACLCGGALVLRLHLAATDGGLPGVAAADASAEAAPARRDDGQGRGPGRNRAGTRRHGFAR